MIRLNFIEKLKVVLNLGRKKNNSDGEFFIAAKNIVNNGTIKSKGCKNNTIISDNLTSTGEINVER